MRIQEFSSSPLGQTAVSAPFISGPGNLCLLLDLYESLAFCTKSDIHNFLYHSVQQSQHEYEVIAMVSHDDIST